MVGLNKSATSGLRPTSRADPIYYFRQVVVVFTIFTVYGRCRDKWEMELERLDLQSGEFNLSFNHYSSPLRDEISSSGDLEVRWLKPVDVDGSGLVFDLDHEGFPESTHYWVRSFVWRRESLLDTVYAYENVGAGLQFFRRKDCDFCGFSSLSGQKA